jgi:hypothetical protein
VLLGAREHYGVTWAVSVKLPVRGGGRRRGRRARNAQRRGRICEPFIVGQYRDTAETCKKEIRDLRKAEKPCK